MAAAIPTPVSKNIQSDKYNPKSEAAVDWIAFARGISSKSEARG